MLDHEAGGEKDDDDDDDDDRHANLGRPHEVLADGVAALGLGLALLGAGGLGGLLPGDDFDKSIFNRSVRK